MQVCVDAYICVDISVKFFKPALQTTLQATFLLERLVMSRQGLCFETY